MKKKKVTKSRRMKFTKQVTQLFLVLPEEIVFRILDYWEKFEIGNFSNALTNHVLREKWIDIKRKYFRFFRKTIVCDRTLLGHSASVNSILQLTNGKIASVSGDGSIKIWNAENTLCEQTLSEHENMARDIIQVDDWIVSSNEDNTIKMWNLGTGSCEKTFTGHRDCISCLIRLNDGRIASSSFDTTIKIWNLDSGECEMTLSGHSIALFVIIQLKDGRIASGSDDNSIKIWNIKAGRTVNEVEKIEEATKANSPSTDLDAVMFIERVHEAYKHEKDHICAPGVYKRFLSTLNDFQSGKLDILRVIEAVKELFHGKKDLILGMNMFLPDKCQIKPEDLDCCEQTLIGHTHSVNILIELDDGRLVSSSGTMRMSPSRSEDVIKIWEIDSGICLQTISGYHPYFLMKLADGRIAGEYDEYIDDWEDDVIGSYIHIWNPDNGVCEMTLFGHNKSISSLIQCKDGRLISGSADKKIKIWNLINGNESSCEWTLEGHGDYVHSLIELSDGRIVSASEDKTIKIWSPDL